MGPGAPRGPRVFWRGEKLDLSHTFAFTSQIRRREPGGEYVSAALCSTALTQFFPGNPGGVCQRTATQQRAPRVFRDKPKGWYAAEVKLEHYLAARRPGLEVRGVDAFEPVANLHRCYLRQDPVFLRSLLRLVGRRVDFYFGHLLPGSECAYVLLRTSFSGKRGSFAQQRPLALSSVRRLQPPCNEDALAYLRALPCLAHQCDPPYIFRTRGGHDLVFHTELRDALFASGLPFVGPGSSTAGPTPSQACARSRTVPSPSCL